VIHPRFKDLGVHISGEGTTELIPIGKTDILLGGSLQYLVVYFNIQYRL